MKPARQHQCLRAAHVYLKLKNSVMPMLQHALQKTYQAELPQVRNKRSWREIVHIRSLFGVHREGAKGYATHAMASQALQRGQGIDHRKEVVHVPKCNAIHKEASDGCECGEKKRKAGVKREVR